MGTPQQISDEYRNLVKEKVNRTKEEVNHVLRNITLNENIILSNQQWVYDNGILQYVKNIRSGKSNYNKYKIIELFKFDDNDVEYTNNITRSANLVKDEIHRVIPIRYRLDTIGDKSVIELIIAAYLNFYKYVLKYHTLQERLIRYENINFNDFVIRKYLKYYYRSASQLILREKEAKFYLGGSVFIYVYGKSDNKYGSKRKKIDWGSTNRKLANIAKSDYPEIQARLDSEELGLRDLYNVMKPYFYSKSNPSGIKPLVYLDKDVNHWLIIKSKYSSIKGIKDYGIVPTNHIDTPDRSQINFAKNAKDVDEIINSDLLGFRDKIRVLERFDMDFCKRNYYNNI